MAFGRIENERLRIDFNEPGVHPFITFFLPDSEGTWKPSVLLGARQLRYYHKGAAFPRMISKGVEEDSVALAEFSPRDDGMGVVISDTRCGMKVETTFALDALEPSVKVVHRMKAIADTSLNRAFDRFDFVCAPGQEESCSLDYHFVPHLRPRSDMVIGDHVFRSPLLMMESGPVFFAMMPELGLMEPVYREGGCRYYMDFLISGGENQCPAVCLGLGNTRVKGHVYFEADFQKQIPVPAGRELVLAYSLLLDSGGIGRRDAVSMLWDRYGHGNLERVLPQVVSWDRYASAGLERIFKKGDLFRRFNLEGQPCGGTVGIHFANRKGVRLMSLRALRSYLRTQDLTLALNRFGIEKASEWQWANRLLEKGIYRYAPGVPPQIMLQSWFNNLRSAYGAYWFARRWNDSELLDAAQQVKNLVILAPREAGAFPAVCYATGEGVFWCRGTRAFKHVDEYHTADCATTGYYMALWFDDHEGDPRLLARCRELAEFFLGIQLPSGAFPAWVVPGEPPRAAGELKESATTACPAMFLARLFMIDGDTRLLDSARRACEFLEKEVVPEQKWFDYETFYSCSKKRLGLFDENTATYPQNTMSMYWAAEALRLLYEATGQRDYLELGTRVLDHLCLYQQVWDTPFLSVNTFGGFGVMNTDGEWNDARQAIVAPVLMDYYLPTGNAEYMERGIAALRASFTLMYLEENRRVAPGNQHPAAAKENGSVAENYGHFGHDSRVPGFLDSDWGAGSACQAAAYAQKHYGDVFVDLRNSRAFGINGCRVRGMELTGGRLSLDVEARVDHLADLSIKTSGATVEELLLCGSPAKRTGPGMFTARL